MFFASDNAGPAHPAIMDALIKVNDSYLPSYGTDTSNEEVAGRIRQLFEAPDAAVYLVPTGTAANALALATLAQPWHGILCSEYAHIIVDECNAVEFYSGGARLEPLGRGDKIDLTALSARMQDLQSPDVHWAQPGPVSVSQVTERGQLYSLEELRAITEIAHAAGQAVHMDGARFANAQVALGCTAAEMSWKAGIDVVSFGGSKNGLLGCEAVIFFDPGHAWEFELRRKRAGHLFSKHRYLSAQMLAYLEDDLWLELARASNAHAARLVAGLREVDFAFTARPQANMIFGDFPVSLYDRLCTAGALAPAQGPAYADAASVLRIPVRMVCDWSISTDQIDAFLALCQAG